MHGTPEHLSGYERHNQVCSQLTTSDGSNPKGYPAGSKSPSGFHSNLSWSHYRALMRVENMAARQFYETEAVQSNWSRRDLARQIGSFFKT
jgi:hypothetical protein